MAGAAESNFSLSSVVSFSVCRLRAVRCAPDSRKPQRPFSYSAYLLRRVTRLEPPFILSLLLRFALIVVVFREDCRQLLPHFLASLLYLHNVIFGSLSRISPPTWSLEVEVQFYLLAPLLARVFNSPARVYDALCSSARLCRSACWHSFTAQTSSGISCRSWAMPSTSWQDSCFASCISPLHGCGDRALYLLDLTAVIALLTLLYSESPTIELLFPLGALLVFYAGLRGVLLPHFSA